MSKYWKISKENKKRPIQTVGLFKAVHGECLITKSDDVLQFMDIDSLDVIDRHVRF